MEPAVLGVPRGQESPGVLEPAAARRKLEEAAESVVEGPTLPARLGRRVWVEPLAEAPHQVGSRLPAGPPVMPRAVTVRAARIQGVLRLALGVPALLALPVALAVPTPAVVHLAPEALMRVVPTPRAELVQLALGVRLHSTVRHLRLAQLIRSIQRA